MAGTALCLRDCEYKTYEGYCRFTACIKRSDNVTMKIPEGNVQIVQLVELTDECIDKIADAVVQKLMEIKEEK